MDLSAAMLFNELRALPDSPLDPVRISPRFSRRFMRLPFLGQSRLAWNADRLLNRLHDYPRHLLGIRADFDYFHVVDHSYAHLVNRLPGARSGVYCHDLDTFRCILEPDREKRPYWFRAMTRTILHGLQRAALVFHSTLAVREQIERHRLVPVHRLVHAPYGIHSEFRPDPHPDERLPAGLEGSRYLLHVGSCIPRKRIDVLLDVFARLRARRRDLHLVQVGGTWTPSQWNQIQNLGLAGAVKQLRWIERPSLAVLYRHAAMVLQPSETEGFGLPVLEALASGAIVIASDIPPLREVASDAAVFCPVGDREAWIRTASEMLADGSRAPCLDRRLARARSFSWRAHALCIAEAYRRLPGAATSDMAPRS